MALVKNFSISFKRGIFSITFICLSPRGKERVIKLHLPFPQMEHLASSLRKAIEEQKAKIPKAEDLRYIA